MEEDCAVTSLVKTALLRALGIVVACTVAGITSGPLQAQVSPELLQGMQWRNVGPFIAGRVSSVAGVDGQPAIAYMGADDGGVWKTENAGTTWVPLTDAVHEIRGITALAVAQSQPQTIYAGTGSTFGSAYSSGVWTSVDAGAHWQSAGLRDAGPIAALLVDPHDPQLLLAATRGVPLQQGGQRGVFRSTDGGQSWQRVLDAGAESGATGVAWAADNPQVVFATVAQTFHAPGAKRSFRNPGPTALYKSSDEGLTWSRVNGHDQPAVIGEVAVAAHTGSQRVYMLNRSGLYRSDDGGASWSLGTKTIYTSGKQVLVDPANPDVLYTLGTAAYRSTDGGHTLVAFKGAPGGDDPNQWWIDAGNPRHIVYGGDQGAVVSLDGGASWSLWYNQPTAQVYKVSTDNQYPYWIYATKQDSGAVAVANRGHFGQINGFFDWFQLPGWETGFVTPDPSDPELIFLDGDLGYLSRLQRGTWQAQIIDPGAGSISNTSDTAYRRAVAAPIVFSTDGKILYYGTQNVWASSDRGTSWRKLSPDLTAHPGKAPEPPPEGVHHGDALTSLSPSTVQAGVLWTGSNNGVAYLSKDAGQHWQDVTPPGVGKFGDVNIQASHFSAGTAYASVDNSPAGDDAPHIYRTQDYGKTWQAIVAGLPTDQPTGSYVRVIREDPNKQGLLFAGTETSVYVSFDDGGHWQPLRLNLPTASYRDLKIHGHDLIAGTYGRAIWVLDDITPLEQMTAGLAQQPVHLFHPDTAVRVQANVNQDTPFPAEVPHARNPPEGAVIDYYLAQPAKTVQLQILDAGGKVVRTYSNAPIAPLDQPLPPVQSAWLQPRLPLPATSGAHRVTWDLRWPIPPAIRVSYGDMMQAVPGGTPFAPQGPLAVPGNYTVKLTVDGATATQPLVVREDPRLGDAPDVRVGMQKQLALARDIVAVMAASKQAYEQGTALESGVAALATGTSAKDAKALQASVTKLTGAAADASISLSGSNYAVPPVTGPLSFSRTNGQASALLKLVTYLSDRAPVAAQYATYQQVCRDFNTTASAWQGLQPAVAKLDAQRRQGAGDALALPVVQALPCSPGAGNP
jgi:photosystem II stability/assembly factor-like uncharacterized protein